VIVRCFAGTAIRLVKAAAPAHAVVAIREKSVLGLRFS